MNSLTTRLEQLYASAVYDALRSMGQDNCVLPPGISALIPGQKLAGEIFTIDGHFEVGQDANKTLLGMVNSSIESTLWESPYLSA